MQKNNLYNTFHPQPNPNPIGMDLVKQYNIFKQDPLYFLLQTKGISIPEQYRNDTRGAIQYLLNNGQMSQEQLNYITFLARRMGIKV